MTLCLPNSIMIRTTTQPKMLIVVVVAVVAYFALTALVSAEKVTTSSRGITPASFSKACLEVNGELVELHPIGETETIVESSCKVQGLESSCDWVKKTCTDEVRLAPTIGKGGVDLSDEDVVVDPRLTPAETGTVDEPVEVRP